MIHSLVCITFAASGLVKQTSYKFDTRKPADIEVGQGNLKLVFSGSDGNLVKYINTRSLVCHLHIFIIFFLFMLSMVKSILHRISGRSGFNNIIFFNVQGEHFSGTIIQILCCR